MKIRYIQIGIIQVLLLASFHSLNALNVNDTIKPIPFIEKWIPAHLPLMPGGSHTCRETGQS